MKVDNLSESECTFTTGIHSYYDISDIDKLGIEGKLKGCTYEDRTKDPPSPVEYDKDEIKIAEFRDEIYKKDPEKGELDIVSDGGWRDLVVWNPYGDDKMGYKSFVCVESVECDPISLAAGASWEATVNVVEIQKMMNDQTKQGIAPSWMLRQLEALESDCETLEVRWQQVQKHQKDEEQQVIQRLRSEYEAQLRELGRLREIVKESKVEKPPAPNVEPLEKEAIELRREIDELLRRKRADQAKAEQQSQSLRAEIRAAEDRLQQTLAQKSVMEEVVEGLKNSHNATANSSRELRELQRDQEFLEKECVRSEKRIIILDEKIESLSKEAEDLRQRAAVVMSALPEVPGHDSKVSYQHMKRQQQVQGLRRDQSQLQREQAIDMLMFEECQKYLPSEQSALERFLEELEHAPVPSASSFVDTYGIVMSGGAPHVLQALANLDVLRSYHKSDLPVEFWHAFELEDAHCEALALRGATCRQLQVPGVYPEYETVLPSVMSSSFRHVLWMDTDITPLVSPEVLFATEAYRQDGALFWPDHWSHDCFPYGQSSWSNHVVLHLLNLTHNASERRFSHEHETGHFLINRERHWRAICLANYLASRDFFTRVLHGYKDVFRLAFLKMNASNWFSPVRPGIVGAFMKNGLFFPAALVQFWPSWEEQLSDGRYDGEAGRNIPLYIHQKKVPGILWTDFVTFTQPMGQCTSYHLTPVDTYNPDNGAEAWNLVTTDDKVAQNLYVIEAVWEKSFAFNLENLQNHPELTQKSKDRLQAKRFRSITKQWSNVVHSCRCDFGNNLWLHVLTLLTPGEMDQNMAVDGGHCDLILRPNLDSTSCPIGFATLAVLCHKLFNNEDHKLAAKEVVGELFPALVNCLPKTFWPLNSDDLRRFVEDGDEGFPNSLVFDTKTLPQLTDPLRRCLPLKSPTCWNPHNARKEDGGVMPDTQLSGVQNSCTNCCGSPGPMREYCFDEIYTEEICCNEVEGKATSLA
eukprot:symbB.v1.2.002726.t1/scaffold146.1/size298692/7